MISLDKVKWLENNRSAYYVHYPTSNRALCTMVFAHSYLSLSEFVNMFQVFHILVGLSSLWSNKIKAKDFFTAMSRMLVFIDESGFFYSLGFNNTLCWWCVIFIARTPVCTARKERIWPEVATMVHSLIGQTEHCSLQKTSDITVHSSAYRTVVFKLFVP